MTKLLILTLAAAALGAQGVPQGPRPVDTQRNPSDNMDETRLTLKMKREVMDMASKSEPLTFPTSGTRRQSHVLKYGRGIEKRDLFDQMDREKEIYSGKYLESLRNPMDNVEEILLENSFEKREDMRGPRRQPAVDLEHERIEKRDVLGNRDREGKYLESLEPGEP